MSGQIRADQVEPEAVEWLCEEHFGRRIPKGMITIIAGRPDTGKGLLASNIAAVLSATGGNVLYSAAEDSHSLMTRPRLEAAGADLERILLWRFALPANQRELAEIVIEKEIGLVIMDPFASHLSGGISRHSDNVRTALQPLTELIEHTGTTVLIVEHALKRGPANGHPLQFIGGGGSGLPAFARAAYVYGKDPDDEDRRILAPAKFNIGPWPKALAFDVEVEDIDVVGDVPVLMLDDELIAFDPMRLFQTKNQPGKVGRPADKRAAAAEWLTTYLADAGKAVQSSKIQEDAKQYNMSPKTLRRAAEDMGVVKNPPGGGRLCTWDLPQDVKEAMGLTTTATASTETAKETLDEDGALQGPLLENDEFYSDPVAAMHIPVPDMPEGMEIGEIDTEDMDDELANLLSGYKPEAD
jgi:hypothetical protein